MTVKQKRKRTQKRPIWQAALPTVVLIAIGIVGIVWLVMNQQSGDGADIIFLRDDGGSTLNLYTLDIDNPDAEAVALTEYTIDDDYSVESYAIPDHAEWFVFIERGKVSASIKQLNMTTGDITLIHDCDAGDVWGCWLVDVSPNGRYLVFGGLDDNSGREVGWVLDLEDDTVSPMLIEDGGIAPAQFISNETIAFWSYSHNTLATFDIATGDTTSAITPIENFNIIEPHFSPDGSLVAQVIPDFSADALFTYDIFHVTENTRTYIEAPYGEYQNIFMAWHPDNSQFLVRASIAEGGMRYEAIALINTETGNSDIIVAPEAQEDIISMAWHPDGTQFSYVTRSNNEYNTEGTIWLYDMETSDSTSLGEVGSRVQWLN